MPEVLKDVNDSQSRMRRIAELEIEVRRKKKAVETAKSYDAALYLQMAETERAQLIADARASWRVVENPLGAFL